MSSPYVELRCRSAFSFLRGASLPEDLAARAAELGYAALALSDRESLAGAVRFHGAAGRAGLQALIGAEVPIGGAPLLLLCESQAGYRSLCRLVTRAKSDRAPIGWDELEAHAGGLFAIAGAADDPLGAALARSPEVGAAAADRLVGIFGPRHLALDLQLHLDTEEDRRNLQLQALAQRHRLRTVLTNDVHYATADRADLCDVLFCTREKVTVDQAGTRLLRNAERYLKPPREMAQLGADVPGAVRNTLRVAERCAFRLDDLGYRFPDYPAPGGMSAAAYLRDIVAAAAPERFRPLTDAVRAQLARELDLITRLRLEGYFLIVWDVVQYCKARSILCQGRGSAANSAVCFALGITAVDPLKYQLLFERFLSEERGEWPDIDLDLPSETQREAAIQYLYKKYGAGCGMTAVAIRYRARSAVRDVGKALGFSPDQLGRLSQRLSPWRAGDPGAHLQAAGLDREEPRVRQLLRLCAEIQDLPRHLSQHPGGLVLAAGRLDEIVPLQPAAMPDRMMIQWDKDDIADAKLIKIDLLGLGMMRALEEAQRLCPIHDGEPFDLAHLPPDDPATYAQLRRADTVGVFQVESRAQMATLPRIQPRTFYDLVVSIALIRPGPIVGKLVHPYIRRRRGLEPVRYAHPLCEPILSRTLGVPLFQEQVMKMAMVCAGFSGGQAEQLRRVMGFRRRDGRMEELEQALAEGMAARGIEGAAAEEILRSIGAFAAYGFPESHSISFALLAYASAYLRVHHPAVFYASLLNAQPMGFYSPASLVKDAQRRGIDVRPIDVTRSGWPCAPEDEERPARALRLGLRYVRGLRQKAAEQLVQARAERPFADLTDLRRRCTLLYADELQHLAEVGALSALPDLGSVRRISHRRHRRSPAPRCVVAPVAGSSPLPPLLLAMLGARRAGSVRLVGQSLGERREALWQVSGLGPGLLAGARDPADRSPLRRMTKGERLAADLRGTGLTLGPHPIELLRPALLREGVRPLSALRALPDGAAVDVAGMVIVRQRPPTAKGLFFLSLEDETAIVNATVLPAEFEANAEVLCTAPALVVTGAVQQHQGVTGVRARSFRALAEVVVALPSHDFC